ncbi:MAG: S41 family peptidase [Candidatus Dormibacteria bacterium]
MAAELPPGGLEQPAGPRAHPSRRWPKRLAVGLLVPLSFYLGVLFQFHAGPDLDQLIAPALFAAPAKSLDLGTLNAIFSIMQREYAKAGLSPTDAFNAAAHGMVHNLLAADPYKDNFSAYFTPEELRQNQEFLAGAFGGIGASFKLVNARLTVTLVLPNNPAAGAGLKVNDVVTKIDGQDATGMTVDEAAKRIRGKPGTHVTLTVMRAGKTIDLDILRQQIKVPSVSNKDVAPGVLYIRISEFGKNTATDFHQQLDEGLKRGDRAVVLDLRRNPGGYVEAARNVISEFVQLGEAVTVVGRTSRVVNTVTGKGVAYSPKLVVLVDENSASAAEITAGALQDHHRGTLVGKKTFGKGLVEDDFPLPNGGDLHLTIAYWLRPSGKTINLLGITPDRVVDLPAPTDFWFVDDASSEPRRDTQLQAALALLK